VFADLDGDGNLDVVSSCEGRERTMYVHWAPAKRADYLKPSAWVTEAIPATKQKQSWMFAEPAQIDGRGGIDLFVSSKGANGLIGWLRVDPPTSSGRDAGAFKFVKLRSAGWIMTLKALDMDGDGDRIGVVDEAGRFIHPDRLMAIFAADILVDRRDGTEAERTIFYDVKCSMALEEMIREAGGIPRMVRTGHSFMKSELRANPDAPLAGEMSGHFFVNDRWPGFDDSLYNTARLLEMIGRDPSPNSGGPKFSERFSALSDYPSTDETKVPLTGEREATMSAVEGAFSDLPKSTVDGIRVTYPNGWYLCRPSNTEPILVMRAEGRDEDSLDAILSDVQNRIGHMLDLSDLR
jgi:hypothetical protein